MNEVVVKDILTRGVGEVVGREALTESLQKGRVLRVKFGVDPTSDSIHLGRAVPLLKLRDFQEMGHTIVLIVGDFTGVIGDTSDKESERPMLEQQVVEEHMQTYFAQIGKVLDLSKAELHYNSSWLSTLTYRDIGEQANYFSLADFIARDNIKRRLDAGKRVSLRELLYPLMQGFDSVQVRADVEVGGVDQRFNMLAGRVLQERSGQAPQAIIMNPLLEGLDGRKMSSSWGNTIRITDTPADMYGKLMSVRDDLVMTYFNLCTRMPKSDLTHLEGEVREGTLHPKELKQRLAREIVTLYHTTADAAYAEEQFESVFSARHVPQDTPEISVARGVLLVDALLQAKVVSSKSDFRRLVTQGAVQVRKDSGDEVVQDVAAGAREEVYRIGKHRFIRITLV